MIEHQITCETNSIHRTIKSWQNNYIDTCTVKSEKNPKLKWHAVYKSEGINYQTAAIISQCRRTQHWRDTPCRSQLFTNGSKTQHNSAQNHHYYDCYYCQFVHQVEFLSNISILWGNDITIVRIYQICFVLLGRVALVAQRPIVANFHVDDLLVGPSVCTCVGLSIALWKNGESDLDAVGIIGQTGPEIR